MTNLAIVTEFNESPPGIKISSGTGVGTFNPHRLGGIADLLYMESEQRKASVKSLHSAVLAHTTLTQQYISIDEHVFLIDLETALKRIDSTFWLKLYDETKLGNFMDTASYTKYKKEIQNINEIIPFSVENIVQQLEMFVGDVDKIMIKRIVNIFEKLSGEHVTNSAYGYRNRMIMASCGRSYSESSNNRFIHDLRCVISTMRGEADMPDTCATSSILEHCFTYHGKWHMIDGGTIRMKAFKKGTMHIEIESSIADKLNAVLASEFLNCLPNAGTKKPLFKSTLQPVEIMLGNGVRNELRRINFEHPLKIR
ncbi:DUF4942 domain-containing protein, partial [Vibrio splendidus]